MSQHVFDLHHHTAQKTALTSQTIDTNIATDGVIIDTAGFEALEFLLTSGTITDGAYAVSLEEGDDSGLSDAAAVDAANVLGNADFALDDDDTTKRIGYIGKKRYVRLVVTSSAVTNGGVFAGAALLGMAAHQPTAD